jgi:hypothetical protein
LVGGLVEGVLLGQIESRISLENVAKCEAQSFAAGWGAAGAARAPPFAITAPAPGVLFTAAEES